MTFKKRLAEALDRTIPIPLEKMDKRLRTNSDFVPIGTGLERTTMMNSGIGPCLAPANVHTNLRRDKVPLSDGRVTRERILQELAPPPRSAPAGQQGAPQQAPAQGNGLEVDPNAGPEAEMGAEPGIEVPPEPGVDPNEITDADLPPLEGDGAPAPAPAPGGTGGAPGGAVPGTPSGSKYTLDSAKGQLDGIIKNWMLLAGDLPEGEQRHNFIEIGERLREISGVLERDFVNPEPTAGPAVNAPAPIAPQGDGMPPPEEEMPPAGSTGEPLA